jgi:hypothetical protein
MRTRERLLQIAAMVLFTSTIVFRAGWLGAASERYSLVDLMVFGTYLNIDTTSYAPDVQIEIKQFVRRSEAYRSKRPNPGSAELGMVYGAWTGYERRLIAAAATRASETLAVTYVTDLAPCYEWEGYHECPEREALFAASYQAAHPSGPFSQYLPLLEAHRWLCAAEGYNYEKMPAKAEQARGSYQRALAAALASKSMLVRIAARELETRATCFAG